MTMSPSQYQNSYLDIAVWCPLYCCSNVFLMYFKCISHLSISYFLSSLSLPPLLNDQNTMYCLPQVILNRRLRDWSYLYLLPGGDDYDCGERGDEYTDHGDYDHELYQMITKWSKYNVLPSTGDPRSSPSRPLLEQVIMIMKGWWMLISVLCVFVYVTVFVCLRVCFCQKKALFHSKLLCLTLRQCKISHVTI